MNARTLARALPTFDHCGGIVTRGGEQDACGKPPVAVIDGRGTEDGGYWPVCAYHANRYGGGRCVPLVDLIAVSDGEAYTHGWQSGYRAGLVVGEGMGRRAASCMT